MSLWSRRNAGFIVIEAGGTDGAGTHAGDQILFDGDQMLIQKFLFVVET